MEETSGNGGAHLRGPVLIIGSGLLGASIGLGLRAKGVEVFLSDISPSTQAVAEDIGAGRSVDVAPQNFSPELVIAATPPDVAAATILDALHSYPRAVVVDIASVKVSVREAVEAHAGADSQRYIGTHPMAGREKSGPVAARTELFITMPWVICPTPTSDPAAVRTAEALAVDLGAVPVRMRAEEHDEAVALISHLPQVMSSLVAARLQNTPGTALALAGNGLRDVTRIAASDPSLWVQILSANAPRLVGVLEGVREDLERLIGTLMGPTAPGARLDMAQLMSEGNAGQARIPGKHGAPPQSFARLTVLVDDIPGQIAALLTEVGEIGVNLEDLRLDHSPGRPVGMVEVSVLPGKHEILVDELTSRGWKVIQ